MTDPHLPSPEELHAQVQHRLIEELSAKELELRRLLASLPETVVQCDDAGVITYLNKAWQTLLGYPVEDCIGKELVTYIVQEDRDSWPGFPEPAKADRKVELRFQASTGEARWFQATLRTTSDGEHTGLLHDVTDRIDLEHQLRQSQKMEAVGRLAGGVAHDFNNLLMVIIGTSEKLLSSLSDEGAARQSEVETVIEAAERAADLTKQLLTFGRQQVMCFQALQLGGVIEEMKLMLERLIGSSVQIEFEDNSETGFVRVDPTHIQQVIMNLAVNARDAMPEGGRLRFELSDTSIQENKGTSGLPVGQYVLLTVRDTGTGIAEEHLDQIFEPFFTTKALGQGTGLGLATTYGIISQSGGTIEVESHPGKGSAFRIFLPSVEEEAESRTTAETSPTRDGEESILVVDDDQLVRRLAVRMLTDQGYVVLEAQGVAEALRLINDQESEIDLVMTDMVMPEGSGKELIDHLTAERPELKILVVSGYGGGLQDDWNQGSVFLQKPFKRETLLNKVREVLDG